MTTRELELPSLPAGSDAPRGPVAAFLHWLFGPFRRGKAPAPQPATGGFYTDTTVCIGCKACEVACKQWNQLPSDGFEFTGNSYDNTGELSATSWRHVKFVEQFLDAGASRTACAVLAERTPNAHAATQTRLRTLANDVGRV